MFTRSLPVHSLGGLETYTWNLAHGLASRGHKITLITKVHPKGITHERINENLDVYYCGVEDKDPYSPSFLEKSAELFNELNLETKFDIVHSQSGGANGLIFSNVKKGLIFSNVKITTPMVDTVHGYWKNSYKNAFRKHTIRSLLSGIRSFYIMEISKKRYIHQDRWFAHFQRTFLISQANFDGYSTDFPQHKNSFVKLYTGIDINKFRPQNVDDLKKELHLESNRVLIYAGRLDKLKGIQSFLPLISKLASKYPDIKMLIIGEGIYRHHLEKLVKKRKIEKYVQFMGYIPNEKLSQYLSLAELFIFPTFYFEGLPLNCIEAISCGLPVLAIKAEGVVDIVKHGINGYLVNYRNKKQFIPFIDKLLSDRDLWKQMSSNARSIALDLFDFQKMVDNTIEIYESVIKK